MSVKSRVRSSTLQLKMLADYMATHPSLAHGEFTGPQGKLREQRQWEELRLLLKEYGPDKTIEQWKVTWRDLRRKARSEGSTVNRAIRATGNATDVPLLSDTTKKILGVMGTEGAFGISGGEESTIGSAPSTAEITFEEEVEPVFVSESCEMASNEVSEYIVIDELRERSEPTNQPRLSDLLTRPVSLVSESQNQGQDSNRPNLVRATRQRQQEPRARADQFLKAELETNIVLRDIANQLVISNRHSAIRSRFTYKEKLWQLRKDLFK